MRRAQGGDRAAFSALVERHYGLVFACAFRRLGNRGDAEDVTQDVMVKFGQAILTLRDADALRGFLLRLTVNAVTDLFRTRQRDRQGAANFLVDPTAQAPAGDEEDQLGALWTAVRALPDQQRDAVLLVYADGASHREAGEALGCAEATVSYHLHAARKKLKHLLKEDAA